MLCHQDSVPTCHLCCLVQVWGHGLCHQDGVLSPNAAPAAWHRVGNACRDPGQSPVPKCHLCCVAQGWRRAPCHTDGIRMHRIRDTRCPTGTQSPNATPAAGVRLGTCTLLGSCPHMPPLYCMAQCWGHSATRIAPHPQTPPMLLPRWGHGDPMDPPPPPLPLPLVTAWGPHSGHASLWGTAVPPPPHPRGPRCT